MTEANKKSFVIGLCVGAVLWTGANAYHTQQLRDRAEALQVEAEALTASQRHVEKRERQLDRLLGEATRGYHASKKTNHKKQILPNAGYGARTVSTVSGGSGSGL
jgi:hypothetical protein